MAGRTGRTGGAGYDAELLALLAVDVDVSGLDKGLDQAKSKTNAALGQMERTAVQSGRAMRFAFQNVAFQVQDFAVQVSAGTNAMVALGQNLPQLLGGFGLWGAAAGAVVAIMGGLIQQMDLTGTTAEDLDEQLGDLSNELNGLKEKFDTAVGAARDFAEARLESAALAGINELQDSIDDLMEQYQDAVQLLRQGDVSAGAGLFERIGSQLERLAEVDLGPLGTSVGEVGAGILNWVSGITLVTAALDALEGGLDPEVEASIQQLAERLDAGTITAVDFRREMEALAAVQPGPLADQIRGITASLIEDRAEAERATQKIADMQDELAQGFETGGLETLRDKLREVTNEMVIALAPKEERPGLEALSAAGRDLSQSTEATGEAAEAVEKINQGEAALERLEARERAAETAAKDAAQAAEKHATALESLGNQTDVLTLKREAYERAKIAGVDPAEEIRQIDDLVQAGQRLDYTFEQIAAAPARDREIMQAYIDEAAAVRALAAAREVDRKALLAHNEALRERHEAERELRENQIRARQREASGELRQEQGRIEAGGELPDQIDAANLAAQELATTLTDLDSLTFESLLGALQNIGLALAQQVIQALIFQAIMSAIGMLGGGAGTAVSGIAGASVGAGFGGATVTPIPRAQHGAIFKRGQMALMTGAVSGAALLEGARDEAAMPLTRTSRGELGVMSDGGRATPTNVYNIDARGAERGSVSTMVNLIHRVAPGAMVNAKARGRVRDRPPL